MYLSAYHFTGDPAELTAAYERLLAMSAPETPLFQVCAVGDAGLTVLDACPDRATHAQFVASAEFRGALAHVRLPDPQIEVLGDVLRVFVQPVAETADESAVPA